MTIGKYLDKLMSIHFRWRTYLCRAIVYSYIVCRNVFHCSQLDETNISRDAGFIYFVLSIDCNQRDNCFTYFFASIFVSNILCNTSNDMFTMRSEKCKNNNKCYENIKKERKKSASDKQKNTWRTTEREREKKTTTTIGAAYRYK